MWRGSRGGLRVSTAPSYPYRTTLERVGLVLAIGCPEYTAAQGDTL